MAENESTEAESVDTTAADAAAAEVATEQNDSFRVDYDDSVYWILKAKTTSYDFLELFEQSRISAYRWLVGDTQFKRFRDAHLDEHGLLQTSAMTKFFRAVDAAITGAESAEDGPGN